MPSAPARAFQRPTARRDRGFTLIEACVAMLVLAVIACAAAPGLQDLLETRRLHSAAAGLLADLQFVRVEAVARNQPLRLSLFVGDRTNCYVVHSGPAGACPCTATGATRCSGNGAEIKTVAWPVAERVALQANVASTVF